MYKLVAVRENGGIWESRIKLSSNLGKMTDPGRKRLVRYYDGAGQPLADIIRLHDEPIDVIDPGQPAKGSSPSGTISRSSGRYGMQHAKICSSP